MSLTYAAFAIAGLVAAAGPVVIHLVHRRRTRILQWAATEFLARAILRTRRRLHLRDVLVLLARMLALILLGLALARPIVAAEAASVWLVAGLILVAGALAGGVALLAADRAPRGRFLAAGLLTLGAAGAIAMWQLADGAEDIIAAGEPIHALFIIDNSQSMASTFGDATRLEAAQTRAIEAIVQLPDGSRVSVIPLCATGSIQPDDLAHNLQAATAAVARIEQTDLAGSIEATLSRVAKAARSAPQPARKRAIVLTDMQASGWPSQLASRRPPKDPDGSLIPIDIVPIDAAQGRSNLHVAAFTSRDGFLVRDSPAVFSATVSHLGPDAIENVEISLWIDGEVVASEIADFDAGQQHSWTWRIAADRRRDFEGDVATARLEIGAPPSVGNRLGRDDTAYLAIPRSDALPVVCIDQYGARENLASGRRGETYHLRRLLAPRLSRGRGDSFVKIRHTRFDALDEAMLADARLVVIAGVEVPTAQGVALLRGFVEQGGSLLIAAGANFDPARWSELAWREGQGILPAPLEPALRGVRPSQAADSERIVPYRLDVNALDHPLFRIAGVSEKARADLWREPYFFQAAEVRPDGADQARVLARLVPIGTEAADALPYLVERGIGSGRVLFLAGGIGSDWDTLSTTNAVILLDRIARSLLRDTMPQLTRQAGSPIVLPQTTAPASLQRPGQSARDIDPIETGATKGPRRAETPLAGFYALRSTPEPPSETSDAPIALWAVNGPMSESNLAPATPERLAELAQERDWRVVSPEEPIVLTGKMAEVNWPWRTLAIGLFLCLALEMWLVADRSPKPRRASQ